MKSPCIVLVLIGIATAKKTLKSGELPLDPSKMALPEVPKAMDKLPDMSVILESSENTMSGISTQATRLQKEIETVQSQNAMRLQHEKQVFDQKLTEQEAKNKELTKQNAGLAKDIMKTNTTNADLLKNAFKTPERQR